MVLFPLTIRVPDDVEEISCEVNERRVDVLMIFVLLDNYPNKDC